MLQQGDPRTSVMLSQPQVVIDVIRKAAKAAEGVTAAA
jgi:hypothetical protein